MRPGPEGSVTGRTPQVGHPRGVTDQHEERKEQVEGPVAQPHSRIEKEKLRAKEDRQEDRLPVLQAQVDKDGDCKQRLSGRKIHLLRLAGVKVQWRQGTPRYREREWQAAGEARPLGPLLGS